MGGLWQPTSRHSVTEGEQNGPRETHRTPLIAEPPIGPLPHYCFNLLLVMTADMVMVYGYGNQEKTADCHFRGSTLSSPDAACSGLTSFLLRLELC